MRNVSDKSCRGNQNTHFVLNSFFFLENRAIYEIMWENILGLGRLQMTIRRMRIACWITKATNTHSECVTLIAFPLQKMLQERASMLCYRYSACPVTQLLALHDLNVQQHDTRN